MRGILGTLVGVVGSAIALVAGFGLWAAGRQVPASREAEIVSYGGAAGEAAAPPETFTVVTYNIGYLSGLTNNQAVARSPALYAENLDTAIAGLGVVAPDVIAFQEIDVAARRSYRRDQVAAIAQALDFPIGAIALNWNKRYVPFPPWPPTAHFGAIVSGQAVLSRFPIQRHDRIVLQKVASQSFVYNAFYLDRLAQVVELEVGGQSVILINLHLEAFDEPTRHAQTLAVRAIAEQYAATYPVIVLGDFNSAINRTDAEEGDTHTILDMVAAEEFQSLVPEADWRDPAQFTFPTDAPRYRLDYGFYTPARLELVATRVLTETAQASDHFPVVMTFRLR